MKTKVQRQPLFSASSVLLLLAIAVSTLLYSSTSAQVISPVQAPTASSPPATPSAPAPGFNTVPLVPTSPNGAPTPNIVPKAPTIDIIQILRKAKRFSVLIRLLKTTQLINQLNSQLVSSPSSGSGGGLTLFAPEDSAFSKLKAGFLNSLSDRQKVELLQFHTLSSFISISNFDTLTNPVQTQAGDDPKRLQLNVTTYGGSQVSMTTGAVNATVTGTVYADNNKVAIYQVDKVLLPLDLVLPPSKAPSPAPLPKSKPDDKTNSSSSSSVDDDGDGGSKDLPAEEASVAGSIISFNSKGMWVPLVIGVALVGEAMI